MKCDAILPHDKIDICMNNILNCITAVTNLFFHKQAKRCALLWYMGGVVDYIHLIKSRLYCKLTKPYKLTWNHRSCITVSCHKSKKCFKVSFSKANFILEDQTVYISGGRIFMILILSAYTCMMATWVAFIKLIPCSHLDTA